MGQLIFLTGLIFSLSICASCGHVLLQYLFSYEIHTKDVSLKQDTVFLAYVFHLSLHFHLLCPEFGFLLLVLFPPSFLLPHWPSG